MSAVFQGRHTGVLAEKLYENRRTGEIQVFGNLQHCMVRSLEQGSGLPDQIQCDPFRYRPAAQLPDGARQIFWGTVQPVGIEAYRMVLTVILRQQSEKVIGKRLLPGLRHVGPALPH